MADQPTGNRSAIIAAALIFLGMLIGGYFLPDAVNYLAQYSVWLAVALGIAFVLAVFLILWLRSRYQKRHGR